MNKLKGEYKMLNRESCKEMWVWDIYRSKAVKKIVVAINDDGSCLAVHDYYEESFKKGDTFSLCYWKHCEEIEEDKMRPMTRDEMLGFVSRHPHIVIKNESTGNYGLPGYHNFKALQNEYSWAPISESGVIGEWHKFEVENT